MSILGRSLSAVLLLCATLAPALHGAELSAGKKKAVQCTPCHGHNGVATNPEAPNLAGESSIYIAKQLNAFRAGERNHQQMSIIAKTLSDDDIANLAAWYEAMKVSVELPEVE